MWKNLDEYSLFRDLREAQIPDLRQCLKGKAGAYRIERYSIPMAAGMHYNYAAKQVDETVLSLLQGLANEQQLIPKYQLLLEGDEINTGEKRKVLHHLTRGQLGDDVIYNGKNMRTFYLDQQEKVREFSEAVRNGSITAPSGKPFTDVVQIGIGGSDLGPRALYLALKAWGERHNKLKLRAHFISNVDPDDAAAVLSALDLSTTLFILVSKSGTTLETLTNERFVGQFLQAEGLNPAKQMVAVTSESSPLANNPSYLASFYMDDFIGGRYSSTSACGGAVLSLAFGADTFDALLAGAAAADKQALEPNHTNNAALMDALIGVYERNILGYGSTAILPYSQALSRFPAHLQQLDMESNGKSVNRFGEPVL